MEESGWTELQGPKDQIANNVVQKLTENAAMLMEYFSLEIDDDGNLKCLPLILDNYVPFMENLPVGIIKLATDIDWENEKLCFKSFCRVMAQIFAIPVDLEVI